jgi:hypothetical protein
LADRAAGIAVALADGESIMNRPASHHLVLFVVALVTSPSVANAQRARFTPPREGIAAAPAAAPQDAASYTATRKLVARSAKLNKLGWLEAQTTFRAGDGLRYTVIREGGDKAIRNRVLRKALDSEVEMSAPAHAQRVAITEANYHIARHTDRQTLRLAPRRDEPTLIDGIAKVDARGRLVQVEGRLAKSPSFWVRSIIVRRMYQAVSGHALPVLVESVADVKLAGSCEFSMWIDYTSIDGRRVDRAVTRPRPSTEPSPLLIALQQQRRH